MIRPELSEAVKHALVAEICKDYVKKPLYEIEQLLQS
jgi:protein required for attachment to host cells